MALGGGTFVTQNKILPGSYINVISAASASAELSDRGIVAIPMALKWGQEGAVITVEKGDFQKNCFKLFGYSYTDDEMKPLREIFMNAVKVFVYRLGTGVKAQNTYATAKHAGTRGNDIQIAISTNVDDATKSDVKTYVGGQLVDLQTVLTSGKTTALADNDFVVWKDDVALSNTAGTALTGGSNASVIGSDHSDALGALEAYAFNVLICDSSDSTTKGLYFNFTKRMRDEIGVKFQCVIHKYTTADYEGVVSVENNTGTEMVYWVGGALAGCAINKSLTNKQYNGEYTVNVAYTQTELEAALLAGKFIFHAVGDSVRVLEDINCLVTTTADKGDIFKDNQTIRVVDQIANDIATLFNTKYLGVVPNDAAGRISLWADIVKHHEQLQTIRAIEDFSDADVSVSQGNTKKSVVVNDVVTVVNTMTQLYMTCIVQ
jgi:hypothetical protein